MKSTRKIRGKGPRRTKKMLKKEREEQSFSRITGLVVQPSFHSNISFDFEFLSSNFDSALSYKIKKQLQHSNCSEKLSLSHSNWGSNFIKMKPVLQFLLESENERRKMICNKLSFSDHYFVL